MRVLLDARLGARGLGIATYLDRLMSGMGEVPEVCVQRWQAAAPWSMRAKLATLAYTGPFDLCPRLEPRARGADVVHYASNLCSWWPGDNSVLTLYDLLYRSRTRSRDRVMGMLLEHGLSRVGQVVAITERTRIELRTAFPQLADRIEVIPPGTRQVPRRRPGGEAYFVGFGGSSDPRKRVGLLIDIYSAYVARTSAPAPLVVLARAGLSLEHRNALIRLGSVIKAPESRAELDEILAGAALVVFPSQAEGLGFPIVEAGEHGVPVVMDRRADISPEIVGRHCVTVDAAETKGWIAGIDAALALGRVYDPLDLPTWPQAASMYARLYERVAA